MLNRNSKIFVAGHNGMIGSSIVRKLKLLKYRHIYTIDRKQLELTNQLKVFNFIKKIKPDAVILAAAKVGGINANNKYRAEFIYENLAIQNNVIHGSFINGVKNLIFLGSSCIYPKNCKQPIKEKYLLSSYLEKTNEPYAIAKIAGVKMCENYNLQYNLNYKCLMPCNSYGINDNYDLKSSHFLPALIRKIIEALKNNRDHIKIWGSGKPLRELIYCDDVADACIFFLKKKTNVSLINIGTGFEKSINEYANYIMRHLGVKLKILHEKKNLDGTFRKLLDSSLANRYGWKPQTTLDMGLSNAINDYLQKQLIK